MACLLGWLDRSKDSVELWASTESLMVSPIDFRQMSSVRTWLINSSKFSFEQLVANVVQNISQLTRRLESRVRAFTSSSKLIPWEESSDNTRLKVLMWEVAGSDSFIFILNSYQISMSFDKEDFFSYTACNFSHNEKVFVSLAMLK